MSIKIESVYSLCLLLNCIDALARELAVNHQVDPDYIVARCLLKQALLIQQNPNSAWAETSANYGWLLPYLPLGEK